jgi:dihydrofolate synthase/folylpolyglutamate synthase
VAVITTVDLDHQDWLGEDRERIGAEKAGIARAWKPLVLGDDDPPSSVLGRAYAIGASAIRAGSDFLFEPRGVQNWCWREPGFEIELPMPRLAAPAQMRNAATAVAALRALDIDIADDAWAAGVAAAHVPGRLQRFVRDGVEIVVDVGHNPQAAREIAAWLMTEPAPGRTHAVYAALSDKDVVGVVDALAERIDRWLLAGLPDAGARGTDVQTLARRLAGSAAGNDAGRYATVAAALAQARTNAVAGDRIVVFGSFHTAAAALGLLQAQP